jgi:hypothetical protein
MNLSTFSVTHLSFQRDSHLYWLAKYDVTNVYEGVAQKLRHQTRPAKRLNYYLKNQYH